MNTMQEGWIKIHRKLLKWEWADSPEMVNVWVHLLLGASYDGNKWHGHNIERGQVVIGREKFSKECGVSVRQLRTCIQRLQEGNQIEVKTTNRFTIVTICKYDDYQMIDDIERPTNDQQTTNKRPANDQQTTTTKEYKESKESKESKEYNPPLPPLSGEERISNVAILNDEWSKHYRAVFSTDYIPNFKFHTSDSESITAKLELKNKEFPQIPTREFFRRFIAGAYNVADDWERKNWSLSLIETRFNQIYQRLINNEHPSNNKRNPNADISREFLEELVSDLRG